MELSKKSLEEAKNLLNRFVDSYEKGIDNAVKYATEAMYKKVLEYCYANGIYNHANEVKWDYNENTKIGRVWTTNMVIIFNEMGTGIVGANRPHPSPNPAFKSWICDKNEHGKKGWYYPTKADDPNPYKYEKNGQLYGWTRGLSSRHMFFDAFNDIKDEIGNIVEIELRKTVGDLY